jgi:hypothetical protein
VRKDHAEKAELDRHLSYEVMSKLQIAFGRSAFFKKLICSEIFDRTKLAGNRRRIRQQLEGSHNQMYIQKPTCTKTVIASFEHFQNTSECRRIEGLLAVELEPDSEKTEDSPVLDRRSLNKFSLLKSPAARCGQSMMRWTKLAMHTHRDVCACKFILQPFDTPLPPQRKSLIDSSFEG